jgi:hypothetical protein
LQIYVDENCAAITQFQPGGFGQSAFSTTPMEGSQVPPAVTAAFQINAQLLSPSINKGSDRVIEIAFHFFGFEMLVYCGANSKSIGAIT